MKFFTLIFKNLRRNKLRSVLTTLAVVALVAIFGLIATILVFMDGLMKERTKDVRLFISSRHKFMGPMERGLTDQIVVPGTLLNQQLVRDPGFQPHNHTLWQFAIFTLDPEMKDINQLFMMVSTYPDKLAAVTPDMEYLDLEPQTVQKLKSRNSAAVGIILGKEMLIKLNKQMGSVFEAISTSHRDGTPLRAPIKIDFEIVGEIPLGNQWGQAGFMDYERFNQILEQKKNEVVYRAEAAILQVDDLAAAERVCSAIEGHLREVRAETLAAFYARFMEPMKGLLWWVEFILVPAILVVMTVILANTFNLSIRERSTEMAVLKVLGFRGGQIVGLVIGEALLVGVLAGVIGAASTFLLINVVMGGLPWGTFGIMLVSPMVLWWGPVIGGATAFFGGILPAWFARNVKVSDVFASVA